MYFMLVPYSIYTMIINAQSRLIITRISANRRDEIVRKASLKDVFGIENGDGGLFGPVDEIGTKTAEVVHRTEYLCT